MIINKQLLLTYLYLLIYICLSSGVILYNKWVLSPKYFKFPYPITLTMIHMGFSAAVAVILVRVLKVVAPVKMTFQIYMTCVVPISAFFASSLCCFFLFVPWYLLEKPGMDPSQITFNFWIFFSNAVCALALNFSIFLVIGRTGAVTIRVAGVLKDWILIALSTVIFPESAITGLNIIGYAIALCGVVMYNYLKVKDVRASDQLPVENIPERAVKDWKLDKKSSDIYNDDDNKVGNNTGNISGSIVSEVITDEEAPLLPSSKLSYIGRTQLSSHNA
ncbi:Glucose-6-phosphate/phosphate and phosphoenolpyruvate/phosphate antiporter domain-containing protein [Dioscorea alata]|uniref:Glucose-6-phosphate/phosphate and phosphoenolpyruvate/phosphate antiporter domain-containing protein n=1 Tax=Dioscorea alata TaxID=55571 RepID=A0ACB7VMM9_DIOAL|nr:Glucose-6-phosphate/phosphate and phosphoenolpyruvate/phosphate antiporter domain-containing protein [Dioscorea alata]